MKKKKKTPLFVPILWAITTLLWLAIFIIDFFYVRQGSGLTVLRFLCVCTSFLAFYVNYKRYKNDKNNDELDDFFKR